MTATMTRRGSDRHLWQGYGWKPSFAVCFTCGFTRREVNRRRANGEETRCRLLEPLRAQRNYRGPDPTTIAGPTPEPECVQCGTVVRQGTLGKVWPTGALSCAACYDADFA